MQSGDFRQMFLGPTVPFTFPANLQPNAPKGLVIERY